MVQARVAVVIPCFNDGSFLEGALASIRESEPVELIVVDDGSTDEKTLATLEQIAARGVPILRRANGGLASARMAGVAATRARYVLPLDSDDELEPGSATRLADALDGDASLAFVYGHRRFLGEGSSVRRAPPWDPFALLYANRYGYSGLYRRDILLEVGGWSLNGCYEDWDLLLAFAECGYAGAPVDQTALHYRRHNTARLNEQCLKRHRRAYKVLRQRHQALFAQRGELAHRAGASLWRQALEPVCNGSRPIKPFWLYWALRGRRSLRPSFAGPGGSDA